MRLLLTAACAGALLAACGGPAPTSGSASTTAVAASAEAAAPATGGTPTGTASATTFETGSMPLSATGAGATLQTLTGENTAQASATGRVTEADAREYCTRDPDGEARNSSMEACIQTVLRRETEAEGGPTHTARADCPAGTLSTSDWGDFRLTGTESESAGPRTLTPIFVNSDGARALGNAGGQVAVEGLFELLCPQRAQVWTSTR